MDASKRDRLLDVPEMAVRSHMSESYFYTNKSLGKLNLKFIKIGRSLRCRESDFEAWLEAQVV